MAKLFFPMIVEGIGLFTYAWRRGVLHEYPLRYQRNQQIKSNQLKLNRKLSCAML